MYSIYCMSEQFTVGIHMFPDPFILIQLISIYCDQLHFLTNFRFLFVKKY